MATAYIACGNKKCVNKGAPYHLGDGEAIPECPVCQKPMTAIRKPRGA